MSVSLTWELVGVGWAWCVLDIDGQHAEMRTSYLGDPLGDLALSMVFLLEGEDEMEVVFPEEPGRHEWRLRRIEGDRVSVTIRFLDEVWDLERNERRFEATGMVFDAQCLLRDLARALLDCLSHLLAKHGVDGYREQWVEHGFPLEEYRALQAMLLGSREGAEL